MNLTLNSAISTFGTAARAKLANIAASGQPEDQLRAPLEGLIVDLAELCSLPRNEVATVGETSLAGLRTRPDYAVTVRDALVGFIEVKAPGKGAHPNRFRDRHDKEQWKKLQSLPNLIYTDGNEFSLWQSGKLVGSVIKLEGDVETSGNALQAPPSLLGIFENFFQWQPIPPSDARQLAEISARLCRLLRDEVTEQLEQNNPALTSLREDWRRLLFPDADNAQFADGYSQTVTFGLLVARAREIRLTQGLDRISQELGQTNSLIGTALRVLTDDANTRRALHTSLDTLTRVLDAVDWGTISRGNPDVWLYFYEDFLAIYDKELRKQTGSYYTPPQVVEAMVRLVDEVLQSSNRFNLHGGLASRDVTIADPAVGTGTFLLGVLTRITEIVRADEGPGAVPAAINDAIRRLIGFELQLGPFAVAQLRLLAELTKLIDDVPSTPLRMFVADTLGSPYESEEWIPKLYKPIAESRERANQIKKQEPITVVIGNPPYRERAKGRGGWVEQRSKNSAEPAPLEAWIPPTNWGVGVHAKHLRNLYIYFWRWATWKVFDQHPEENSGIVCFITVAGFLNGPGFEQMRDYLRRTASEIWVIDCSPEGHQPGVKTRIFQGVQQPVCIVLVARTCETDTEIPARVKFLALPKGHRDEKFAALKRVSLDSSEWVYCSSDWRSPFLREPRREWSTFPALEDLFLYNGSGVMPGRTWIIAPDSQSLQQRWQKLINAPAAQKETLFHPHLRGGKLGDKHSNKVVNQGLPGYDARLSTVANERGDCITPRRYAFRSFDRQWIIPDNRLINQPNPALWEMFSEHQVYLTAFQRTSPSSGPAFTLTALVPDLHHYKGSFGGRVFPLWQDRNALTPNIVPQLISYLSEKYQFEVLAEDVLAYLAAVGAHPAFTERFQADLANPGLRIPFTSHGNLFSNAVEIGKTVIWLHTFGERFIDPNSNRPNAPRIPGDAAPRIPIKGAISQDSGEMPDTIEYDKTNHRLLVGNGYVERVSPQVWKYEVSGKQVLRQWFSYRKANRERPIIGNRRQPSPLDNIQPDHWLAEYTTELINLLHVLEKLVQLEPIQEELLEQICTSPIITVDELRSAGVLNRAGTRASRTKSTENPDQISIDFSGGDSLQT
ncbi:type ISP restriction/modification enzyme [Leptolyngbya sp. AN02str]|uniref:type ISP restriction/modification enzyme n=1 Tax=Leptolyngbya sp. AN02str TaxID=3423363 RepID=UPI003D312506